MSFSVILLSGGQGLRLGHALPKQYLPLKGKAIVLYSLEKFLEHPDIAEIIIVCAPEYRSLFPPSDRIQFALPGRRRQDSVYNGLQCVANKTGWVCVHDGARPFLTHKDLNAVLLAAKKHGAATLASPAKNTIKESNEDGCIASTLDRTKLWEAYTPQVASYALLSQGFALAGAHDVTDDNSIVALTGHPVKLVLGSTWNIKITTPDDLILAERLCDA